MPQPNPDFTPTIEQEKLVRLTTTMCLDYLRGTGCTHGAFIMNLRMIADELEKLKPTKANA